MNPALLAHLEAKVTALEAIDPAAAGCKLSTHNQRLRNARLALARAKGAHTEAEWLALVEETNGDCVRCGMHHEAPFAPVKAHILPVAAGGSDAIENIMPVCRQCASARGEEGIDWLASYRETHGLNAEVKA